MYTHQHNYKSQRAGLRIATEAMVKAGSPGPVGGAIITAELQSCPWRHRVMDLNNGTLAMATLPIDNIKAQSHLKSFLSTCSLKILYYKCYSKYLQ